MAGTDAAGSGAVGRLGGEDLFYVTSSGGIALATSCYAVLAVIIGFGSPLASVAGIAGAALLCLVAASAIGEVASAYPSSPGLNTYLAGAFGPRPAMTVFFCYLFAIVCVAGLEIHVLSGIVAHYVPAADPRLVGLGFIAFVTAFFLRGMTMPRRIQMVAASVLITVIAGLSALVLAGAAGRVPAEPAPPAEFGAVDPGTIGLIFGMSVFLFVGFEWVTPLGRSRAAYRGRIARAMRIAILVLAANYLLFVLAFSGLPVAADDSGAVLPQIAALDPIYGRAVGPVVIALAALATWTSFNVALMGGSMLLYMVAREGTLPRPLTRISAETGAPLGAIATIAGLSAAMALVVSFRDDAIVLARIASIVACGAYAALMAAVLVLRRRGYDNRHVVASRVPSAVVAAVGVAFALLGVASLASDFSMPAAVLLALILVCAFLLARRAARRPRAAGGAASPTRMTEGIRR
ncbi:MAG: APC family permease [Azospirillaceae bacterium]